MVETIRLESGHTLTGIGGSNPSLSAITFVIFPLQDGDAWTDSALNRACYPWLTRRPSLRIPIRQSVSRAEEVSSAHLTLADAQHSHRRPRGR